MSTMPTDQTSFNLVQVSDCHLHPQDAESMDRFARLRQRINRMRPDQVVISGDLTNDGFLSDGVFERMKQELDLFDATVLIIPGNHDVGDKPGMKHPVRREHLERWKQVFSQDRFAVRRGGWMILGMNTQLAGCGLEEERQQMRWLDEQIATCEREKRLIAFFGHLPAYLLDPDETLSGSHAYWQIEPTARAELVQRLRSPALRLAASGHLHWHQVFERGSATWVWCPSCSFIVDDACFPTGGDTLGFVRYAFTGTGVTPHLETVDEPRKTIHVFRPRVEIPGREPIDLVEMVLDFTGTLSRDGKLLPPVAQQLVKLAKELRITVMTADTFGTAREALADLPVRVELIETGADKLAYVERRGAGTTVAVGNGRNDVPMVKAAAVGIAVVGPEGAAGDLVRVADVVVNSIEDAFDLVLHPMRLKATLRE